MSTIRDIVFIIFSCFVLGKGAAWLVDSAARIAHRFGISDLVIGLTIVAFGTSAPEFAVTIVGAIKGTGDISVGNVIGSNLFNIGVILGVCAIFSTVKTRASLVWRDGLSLLAITVLALYFLWDLQLTRVESLALVVLLVVYLGYLLYQKEMAIEEEVSHEPAGIKDVFLFLLGLVFIVCGGHFLVEGAVGLARFFGMAEWVIAMTVVAAGTSIPELVVSLVAIIKKQHGISAGNLIGSNIFNTLGVLGVAGVIRGMQIDSEARLSIILLAPLTLLVIVFMRTGWKVSRLEGVCLIGISLAIWAINFLMVKPG